MSNPPHLDRLLAIMAALRHPESGCPWDQVQTFASIAPYTIEEAYEVADAIARNDLYDLQDELGDLLLQVVYHARMAEEIGAFTFADVVEAIASKLVRRHPHVFGTATADDAQAVKVRWEDIKAQEKAARAAARPPNPADAIESVLDGVPLALPALLRAEKLSARAARVGFDWRDPAEVIAKIREELAEVETALAEGHHEAIAEEIGDLAFAVANLARKAGVPAETALHHANAKFSERFRFIERQLRDLGRTADEASLDEMEALWQRAKTELAPREPPPPDSPTA